MLQTIETQLTHTHNMLQVAYERIEQAIETGSTQDLTQAWSLVAKADDCLIDQIDNLVDINLKPVK